MSNFTKIKRTIQVLQNCYPNQKITKETIIKCLCNQDFQDIYIN